MLIVYLEKSGHMVLYIAPRMELYVKLSALGLYAASVYQVYLAVTTWRGAAPDCECEHDHTPSRSLFKNIIIYGLFILPLGLGFILPNETMNSTMAAKKGVNLNSASQIEIKAESKPDDDDNTRINNSTEDDLSVIPDSKPVKDPAPGSLDALFPSDSFTEMYANHAKTIYHQPVIEVSEKRYIETITTLDLYMDAFQGKKVSLSGFVFRGEGMEANQFAVSRFSLQCCSADAAPFGILAEFPEAKLYADDEWLQVEGVLSKAVLNDIEIMKLNITKVVKIEAPKTPYVYPDLEFGT
jgi:uncharacterized repeat protein (TIGR03943 family)